ncbi:hypothetical protein RclHR1_25110001 [Rhizophagus clarus]|uniref:Uncharacterized protein n=1 Tax=Rhizophagus clarus TaxID=94130 RepID=A0A2Z6REK2_9GLOM|nr:hypothetical protein RclHR1_25110001 [Rhizophagus clarus]
MAKPFVSRTNGEKNKQKSNDLGEDATHIITGYRPNLSLGQYVRDILVYDVPAKRSIKWFSFPASWSLKERKEKERFQAVVQGSPDSFTADALAVKEHLTNFVYPLHIKAFKEVKNPDGTRKMIAYFKSWEDLQNIISKESFWNRTKLSWYHHIVPSFITRRKSSQQFSSNRQDKPNKLIQDPPSKRTKLSSRSKTDSPATGSNRVPIRSLLKDSSQLSSGNKTGGKNKKSQKTNDKSTGTSPPKKLSKRQLHAEIVELKTVLMDFIQKQS